MPIRFPPGTGRGGRSRRSAGATRWCCASCSSGRPRRPGTCSGTRSPRGWIWRRSRPPGIAAIEPLLEAAAREDVAALHRAGIFVLFGWGVTADHDDTSRNLLWLSQAGLGLPDRESYFDDAAQELRAAYVEHIDAQLGNAGVEGDGAAILAFETRLAELHWRAEERRDTDRTHNRYDIAQLVALAPGLDGYLRRARRAGRRDGQCREPDAAGRAAGGPGRDRARDPPRVLRLPCRQGGRRRAAEALRRRGLRLLRPPDPRPAGAARALQARDRRDRRRPRRGAGRALRRDRLLTRGQGAGGADGRGDPRGDAGVDPHPRVDERRDAREGRGQARHAAGEDRLPGPLARLDGPRAAAATRTPPTGSRPPASRSTASWPSCPSRWTAASGRCPRTSSTPTSTPR